MAWMARRPFRRRPLRQRVRLPPLWQRDRLRPLWQRVRLRALWQRVGGVAGAGPAKLAEDEDAIVLPAPLVYGLGFWWGFHLVVMFIWWGFMIRRMVVDPRDRKVLDKKWGQDGVDWYEPIAFDCH